MFYLFNGSLKSWKLLFFTIPIFISSYNSVAQVTEGDSLALVAFYNSTNGSSWLHDDNWLSGPVSTWYGIAAKDGRVDRIFMNFNLLSGELPVELGNLSKLKSLLINDSNLTGSIPESIGNLTDLENLSLFRNSMSGQIPSAIGNLTKLEGLTIGFTNITGPIPSSIGNLSNLRHMQLIVNDLSGEIPEEIYDLDSLEWFSLFNNNLEGELLPKLGDLKFLNRVLVQNNRLHGEIPSEIGNLSDLVYLNFSGNQFSGSIPVEIAELDSLIQFIINDNDFSGLPDFSDKGYPQFDISENKFEFDAIEKNIDVPNIIYNPQKELGKTDTINLMEGEEFQLSYSVGGTQNKYQWMKNGVEIEGQNTESYTIPSVTIDDAGVYQLKIQSDSIHDLVLMTAEVNLEIEILTSTGLNEHIQTPRIYPNPFMNSFSILSDELDGRTVELEIYHLDGRKVLENEILIKKSMELGSGLQPGIYLALISLDGKQYKFRVAKY